MFHEYYITDMRNCEITKRCTSMNSKKALTSLQKENSRGTQGAWKDRALNDLLEIHATAAPFRSATGILQAPSSDMLQAPGPGHEDPGESDETPQASGEAKAKWRARVSICKAIKPNKAEDEQI